MCAYHVSGKQINNKTKACLPGRHQLIGGMPLLLLRTLLWATDIFCPALVSYDRLHLATLLHVLLNKAFYS